MCLAKGAVVEPDPAWTNTCPIVVLLVLGFLFAALSFVASSPPRPRASGRPRPSGAPYECGIVPDREPPQRFPVRFYLVAMIFIIFDIEIVFLYPWAVIFSQLRTFGLVEVLVFAAVVFASFLYLVPTAPSTGGRPSGCGRAMPEPGPPNRPSPVSGRRAPRRRARRPRSVGMGLEDLQHNFLTGRLEDWSSGRGATASGPPPSGWPAAPSR